MFTVQYKSIQIKGSLVATRRLKFYSFRSTVHLWFLNQFVTQVQIGKNEFLLGVYISEMKEVEVVAL